MNFSEVASVLADLATVGGIAAGCFAYFRYRNEMRHQRWLDAKSLYVSVLDDQIANPGFRGDRWATITDEDERYRYSVFVNKLLWSLEGMLKVDSEDEEWRRSAEHIAGNYRPYLDSADFRREALLFSPELRAAIKSGAGLDYDVPATIGS